MVSRNEPLSKKDIIQIVLFSLLLLLAMTVQTATMTMILTALALVVAMPIGKTLMRNFRAYLCVPTIGLLGYALMQGLGAIYSDFGAYAVAEYYKFLAVFALAIILLARFEKRHVRGLLWGFAAICAGISLVCVDMGCSQKIFNVFSDAAGVLGADYSVVVENSQGARINGIYNDANITGALLGLAIILSLYLTHTSKKIWEKALGALALGISAVGFLVAMSRGAILCFGLSALCYLVFEGKDGRLGLFFLMLATAVALAVTGVPAVTHMEEGSMLPVGMAFLCGVVVFLLDWLIGQRTARLLQGHGVAVLVTISILMVVAATAIFGAFNVMEPYTFTENSYLFRAVELEPGDYTLSGDCDGADTTYVMLYTRTPEQVLLNQTTTLYNGLLRDASFTVPRDVGAVSMQFRGDTGDVLREITVSDGTVIPLRYRFVPEMIAQRLQEPLLENLSYMLRVQYVKDGWKLFLKSPLIGHGLGSTEGLITSVQPFYYESKYLHNHVMQVMQESGLVGLTFFVALMLGVAWLMLRGLKSEQRPWPLRCWLVGS